MRAVDFVRVETVSVAYLLLVSPDRSTGLYRETRSIYKKVKDPFTQINHQIVAGVRDKRSSSGRAERDSNKNTHPRGTRIPLIAGRVQ